MSAFPNNDDWISNGLDSFIKSGKLLQSAAPAKSTATESPCDFLSVLGIAQSLNIDFLPITWQPALDSIGQGGTAEVRQALVNIQTSFAFKRLASEADETRNFRAFIAEMSVLGHTLVRDHPNIIRLEGVCWDVVSGGEKVRPVLVFEKAQHGDLHTFMGQSEGKSLTIEERINICADIATAVRDMHSSGIIHGDIKPANVLIFETDSNRYIAKVADFGYSTQFASKNELVNMPRSQYWAAPEWHHRGFTPANAMKMDTYSFGILCLWLLFYNNQENTNTTCNFYSDLNSAQSILVLAQQSVIAMASLDNQRRSSLNQLFDLTLANNPAERSLDFNELICLFAPNRATVLCTLTPLIGSSYSLDKNFQVMPSIRQLYLAQYEVRAYIALCLKYRVATTSSPLVLQDAAFELAFCYKLGFGLPKDDEKSESLLNQSMRERKELEDKIDKVRQGDQSLGFQEGTYNRLETQGYDTRIELGQYYREQQQLDKIELGYRREIIDIRTVLGDEHIITQQLKLLLSFILDSQGRWKEAEDLFVQVTETSLKVVGAEHPDTLISIANLASTYAKQGRWKEAKDLDMQVIETSLRVLGLEHPFTLSNMANLAWIYRNQGQWKEAENFGVQVMETRKRVLGAEHPDTLTSMGNLALTYWNQGQWKKSEDLEAQVMEMRKRVLGVEHPDTLTSIVNLASTYKDQGQWKEAEDLEVQVVETRKRVQGTEHPDTLTSMANLALTYGNQDRWKEAGDLEMQVTETRMRVLGAEHPSTLKSMADWVWMCWSQGWWKEAEDLGVHVMEARKRVLGAEHPDTLTSVAALASTYKNQGRWKEAEDLETQVIETRKRVLGAEHPDTLAIMNNLAHTLYGQDRNKEATKLMEHVVKTLTATVGANHPHTLAASGSLNAWTHETY